jgi:hypothetical protein
MQYRLSEIPSGSAGTDATVREIIRLVHSDLKRPATRLLATRLIQSYNVPSKDHYGEIKAIYQFVSRHIRYQKDPIDIETVQSPEATWAIRAGDCDDHCGLVVALATTIGIPARLRVLGYSEDEFVHILPELKVNGVWYPADTTEPGRGFGWRPEKFPVERVYNLNGEVRNMSLAQAPVARKEVLEASIYNEVMRTIKDNWARGRIDRGDVVGYLRVISEGNFPSKEPVLVDPARRAIKEFLSYVDGNSIPSRKTVQSGLQGLDGLFSSVWKAVKKGVGVVVGVGAKVLGVGTGQPAPVIVQPQIHVPENVIQTQFSPGAASAMGAGMFGSGSQLPMMLGIGALALILILKK